MTFFRKLIKILAILAIPFVLVWGYLGFVAKDPVFGPEEDVDLGEQTVAALAADPENYPILPREDYPEAYEHLNRITQRLVSSSAIQYRDLFRYDTVRIIDDDETLNAFCTAGGFIYVYSGLIRYLESEDHLAGIMGHEIAHAELRHSSMRLQREYGRQRVLEFILLTQPMAVTDAVMLAMLKDLTSLSWSRGQEAEADTMSVSYLKDAGYACDGTAGFFVKLLANQDDVGIPEVLSDHPNSERRVRDIKARASSLGCSTRPAEDSDWAAFQASLPPAEDAVE
jgi:predicted Zn-dependent protease